MAEFKKIQLELDHKFDQKTGRHYINGYQTVFHCHHYTTLYTQLAIDAKETALLSEVAEESFYQMLSSYYSEHNISTIEDRISIACQYYGAIGLGKIEIIYLGDFSGEVKSEHSHVEEGWIKKWKKYDRPVNYIGVGYVSAMFAAVLGKPVRTFAVSEHKSIVKGDPFTLFKVVKN